MQAKTESADRRHLLTPPAQVFWLSGGMRLIVDAERSCRLLTVSPHRVASFKLGDSKIGSVLFDYKNIRVLAHSMSFSDRDLNDPIADQFVLFAVKDREYLTSTQQIYWSGVGNVFNENGKYDEEGMVRRLRTQMRVAHRRFEKLFSSYSHFLDFEENDRSILFRNKHSQNIGLEFSALLDSLFSLRDAVNSIAFRLLLGGVGTFDTKKLKTKILGKSDSEFSTLLASSMFEEASGDLLLRRMSTYRAVALHCLGTTNPVTGDGIYFRKDSGIFGSIRRVVFPLYDDMQKMREIETGTPAGFSFRRDDEELRRFMERPRHDDALDFGFLTLARLLDLCRLLGSELGLESRLLTLTDNDIIDFKTVVDRG
ncbi:hypothetical protein [Mesorhizobium sp. M0037]|uniref:hypothetical protein n=1 Tax=unclassified Mesorhizobium TaxID=325217 RepID=UPI00333A4F06